MLEEKLSTQRKILIDKQILINTLETEREQFITTITERDGLIDSLRSEKLCIEKEYDELATRYERSTKEIKDLQLEIFSVLKWVKFKVILRSC